MDQHHISPANYITKKLVSGRKILQKSFFSEAFESPKNLSIYHQIMIFNDFQSLIIGVTIFFKGVY